jgi:IS5 family transposase
MHQRVVAIAQEKKIIQGRKLRVDTTVVETDIHYPTDSSLLGDGVRVLTPVMKKVTAAAGKVGSRGQTGEGKTAARDFQGNLR